MKRLGIGVADATAASSDGNGNAAPDSIFSAVALLPPNEFALADPDSAGNVAATSFAAPAADVGDGSYAVLATTLPPNEFDFTSFDSTAQSSPDFLASLAVNVGGGSDAVVTTPFEDGIFDRLGLHTHLFASASAQDDSAATGVSFAPATSAPVATFLLNQENQASQSFAAVTDAGIGALAVNSPHAASSDIASEGSNAAAPVNGGAGSGAPLSAPAISAIDDLASLINSGPDTFAPGMTDAGVGSHGATAAQVQAALDESGLSVNGSGIKVGVLSDSFNDLGGAAADEADGALPSAANVQILKDLSSGGTDEGRAMMEIIHDIAPGASLAFYTAFDSEQDFANGILSLAAAGAKVIVDDVSYFDEPFFQNGVVAQAIQTVEAEGVTYVTAAGNEASNAYQAAWTPTSGIFDGTALTDAESFGGSIVQTITVGANSSEDVPLLLEWNQPYGAATSDLEILVFSNGQLLGGITNRGDGEPTNPWVAVDLAGGATYQIAVENLAGPNPGLIKEITAGDGLPVTISGANVGTVFGHAMTPGAITAGAVSAADTPAFGFTPTSESFSSSGAGTELLFANNGTALSSPDALSPVVVSGVDDVHTSVPGGLSDFYGTSAASASLAGVAALILSANPNLTPAQVEQIMEETADPMGNSAVSGAGLVQVGPAVAAAALPGITVAGTTSDAVQGGAAVTLLAGAAAISDGGKSSLASAAISIANASGGAVAGDELSIDGIQNGSAGSGITASWNAATDTLTLTGAATIAAYETLLDQITFTDTGTDSSSGSHPERTVTWSVNDGTSTYNTTSQVAIDRPPVASNDATSEAVGSIITKTAATGVLANDSDVDRDALRVIGVNDTAHGAGTVGASLAGAYGHLTLSGDGSYSYVGDNTSAINSAPTGSHLLDTFTYSESDGNGGTASATLTITLDRSPVVSVASVALSAGDTSVAASSLFTASDPDGNALTTYAFIDVGTGHFVLNGVAQPDNTEIDVTAAQLLQLTYQYGAAAAADTIQVRVNDGTAWSAWAGFTVTAPPVVIQTDGTTSLTELGDHYFLDQTGGSGPELVFNGTAVSPGQFGTGWAPIGAIQTASGYEVAWEGAGTNQFTIWNIDSNGNFVSVVGPLAGNSVALESYETTFQQDLNGDGSIGAAMTVIRVDGTTSLAEVGGSYVVFDNGSDPPLTVNGAPVLAGEFGAGWAPIGAVQTASGYQVAWEGPGNEFTIWDTDANGNLVSVVGPVSGNSLILESYEPTFHQDLNGDGSIGTAATVIESNGSTDLTEISNNYYLFSNGSGPELKFDGAPVAAGTFGAGWSPIGAEQTATGYEVAWEGAGTNRFTIWQTDSNGNFVSVVGPLAGNSAALESYEASFHQDLNGDGSIGTPLTVIEADGSTDLTQIGDNYYLYSNGSGPDLKYGGAPVLANTFGTGWSPIGAEQTAAGYEVAWQGAGTNQFTIWQTDSSGNFLGVVGPISGNSATLESYEPSFHQDLNGDGTIGIPAGSGSSVSDGLSDSTFLFSDDGNGAATIVESSGSENLISGTLTFDGNDAAADATVSIAPQNGGSGYVGSFTAEIGSATNGQESVGWHFNLDPSSIAQTITQSYDVTVSDGSGDAMSQSLSVTVGAPGSDTFMFKPGMGADIIANATTSDTIELDGFASVADGNQLQTLLSEAQAGQSQSLFQAANGGHDTVVNLGNGDSVTLTNVQITDLHASNFIVHPPIIG